MINHINPPPSSPPLPPGVVNEIEGSQQRQMEDERPLNAYFHQGDNDGNNPEDVLNNDDYVNNEEIEGQQLMEFLDDIEDNLDPGEDRDRDRDRDRDHVSSPFILLINLILDPVNIVLDHHLMLSSIQHRHHHHPRHHRRYPRWPQDHH